MRTSILFFLALIVSGWAVAQNPSAYEWFTAEGKKTSFEKLVKATEGADIVLFGELHDDPMAHWMQLLLTQRMEAMPGELILGAEMLERDQQAATDAYLNGTSSLSQFVDSNKLWSNFKTDYLPIVDFAKEHKIPFVATNIPRRYASMVFKKGLASLDTLPAQQKQYIVTLPYPMDTSLSQYSALVKMGMEMHGNGMNFALSQAIKDATMAESILKVMLRSPSDFKTTEKLQPRRFLHFNGAYHSDFYQSIMWYLLQRNPDLKIVTISTVTQENLKKLEPDYKGKADFILVVPATMIRTM